MTTRAAVEVDAMLAETAKEYAAEERMAAVEEAHEKAVSDTVFSVRLQRDMYEEVRLAAQRAHLAPSALIRTWVAERLEADSAAADTNDLTEAVETLARDVERIRRISRAA